MPQLIAGAVVSGLAPGLVGTTAGALLGAAVQLGVGLAASQLAMAIQGKPGQADRPGIRTEVTLEGGTLPQTRILGRSVTAGAVVAPFYSAGRNGDIPNAFRYKVIDLADAAVSALLVLWVDDTRFVVANDLVGSLTSYDGATPNPATRLDWTTSENNLFVRFFDGRQTTADPLMVDRFGSHPERPWTAARIGKGVPYVRTIHRYDDDVVKGEPQLLFEVEGERVYDRRKDGTNGGSGTQRRSTATTWAFSDNPFVLVEAVMRGLPLADGAIWGLGVADADLPAAAWTTAADHCDEVVDGARRYRAGIEAVMATAENGGTDPFDVIDELLKSCAGAIADCGGTWAARCGPPGLPVAFFSDEDVVVSRPQDFEPHRGLTEVVNAVRGLYADQPARWKPKEAPLRTDAAAEAEDGERLVATIDLTKTVWLEPQVQRLQRALLKDARRMRRHSITLPPEFSGLLPLDVVAWTSARNGYDAKLFEIGEVAIDPTTLAVTLALREVDPADYDWTPGYSLPSVAGSTGKVVVVKEALPGFAVQGVTLTDASGAARRPAIELSWSGVLTGVASITWETRILATGAPGPGGTTTNVARGLAYQAEGILPLTTYEVRARGDRTGWSAWLTCTTPDVRIGGADLANTILMDIADAQANAEQAAMDAATALSTANAISNTVQQDTADAIQQANAAASSASASALSASGVLTDTIAARDATEAYKLATDAAKTAAETAKTQAETALAAAQLSESGAYSSSTLASNASTAAIDAVLATPVTTLRLPAEAWTDQSTTAGVAPKAAVPATSFVTDTDYGQAYEFATTLVRTVGQSMGFAFKPSRVYDILYRFKVAAGPCDVTFGLSTQLGAASVQSNLQTVAASFAVADGLVARTIRFGPVGTSASGVDAVVVVGTGSADRAFPHIRQNAGGSTTGRLRVAQIVVRDVTDSLASASSASAAATSASGASTSATNAGTSATAASTSATTASTKAGEASTSATQASSSQTSASGSATSASNSATAAANSASGASGSASAAAGSASTASTKATDASTSATAANTSKVDAQAARDTAQGSATASSSNASAAAASASASSTSAAASESSRQSAVTAKGAAESARDTAVTSKDTAVSSASTATSQASLASGSATNAGNSATAANTSAGAASTSASNAGSSATAANTSAVNANTSAGAADVSRSQAASSATGAAGSATSASDSLTLSSNIAQRGPSVLASQYLDRSRETFTFTGTLPTYLSNVVYPVGETWQWVTDGASDRWARIDSSTAGNWPGVQNALYYRVECEFTLVSGSLDGAGVTVDWLNTVPTTFRHQMSFKVGAKVGAGGRYVLSFIAKRPTTYTGAFNFMRVYLMADWGGFVGELRATKTINVHRLSVLGVTDEELGQGEVGALLTQTYYTKAQSDSADAGSITAYDVSLKAPGGGIGLINANLTANYYTGVTTDQAIALQTSELRADFDKRAFAKAFSFAADTLDGLVAAYNPTLSYLTSTSALLLQKRVLKVVIGAGQTAARLLYTPPERGFRNRTIRVSGVAYAQSGAPTLYAVVNRATSMDGNVVFFDTITGAPLSGFPGSVWTRFALDVVVPDADKPVYSMGIQALAAAGSEVRLGDLEFSDVTDDVNVRADVALTYLATAGLDSALATLKQTVSTTFGTAYANAEYSATAVSQMSGSVARVSGLVTVAGSSTATGFEALAFNSAGNAVGSTVLLWGDYIIAPGTLSTNILSVGLLNNLLINTDFEEGTRGWEKATSGAAGGETNLNVRAAGQSFSGQTYPVLQLEQIGSASVGYADAQSRATDKAGVPTVLSFPVEAGKWYDFSIQASLHRCTGALYITWRDNAGANLGSSSVVTIPEGSGSSISPKLWPRRFTKALAPAGATYAHVIIRKFGTLTSTTSYLMWYRPMASETHADAQFPTPYAPPGTTLVEGGRIITRSIYADHIAVGAITAASGVIAALAVTNLNLAGYSVAKKRNARYIQPKAGSHWILSNTSVWTVLGTIDIGRTSGYKTRLDMAFNIAGDGTGACMELRVVRTVSGTRKQVAWTTAICGTNGVSVGGSFTGQDDTSGSGATKYALEMRKWPGNAGTYKYQQYNPHVRDFFFDVEHFKQQD